MYSCSGGETANLKDSSTAERAVQYLRHSGLVRLVTGVYAAADPEVISRAVRIERLFPQALVEVIDRDEAPPIRPMLWTGGAL